MYVIQAMNADGHWYELPYRFTTREELGAFIAKMRHANPGRAFRCAKV